MDIDIRTKLAGVEFASCILNASGPGCTTLDELRALGKSQTGGIVTKSCTVLARQGNEEPRQTFFPNGAIQAMGLPNPGYKVYTEYIPLLKQEFPKKPVIISVAGLCGDDNRAMLREFQSSEADLIELNLSCPNIDGKPQLAYDFEATDDLLQSLSEIGGNNIPMGIKLPPYFDKSHIGTMADIIKQQSIVQFLSCVNSVGNCLLIDIDNEKPQLRANGGFGGLCGECIKPIGLGNVRSFRKQLPETLSIFGVGGIQTGCDVFEYLLAGASAVQTATQYWKEGPDCFLRLENELRDVLVKKHYKSVSSCINKLNSF